LSTTELTYFRSKITSVASFTWSYYKPITLSI